MYEKSEGNAAFLALILAIQIIDLLFVDHFTSNSNKKGLSQDKINLKYSLSIYMVCSLWYKAYFFKMRVKSWIIFAATNLIENHFVK